jgi:hypothetical protein
MEELKLLIEAIAGLPTMTVWVLCGYLIYKLAMLGSVYGVVRFAIQKFVEWRTAPLPALPALPEQVIRKEYTMRGITVNDNVCDRLERQVLRLRTAGLTYLHDDEVNRLQEILDKALSPKETAK